jgi:hypothetical protein
MKSYRPLAATARNIQTDEETLLEFQRQGWIEVVDKNGGSFISGQDEYRSRFILHLRKKLRLTDREIGIVLANSKPPYSVKDVSSILTGRTTEC